MISGPGPSARGALLMRALAIGLVAVSLLVGCLSRPAQRDRSGEVSYTRRDGVFTIYSNTGEERPAEAPPPPRKTTLSCERGQVCDPSTPAR